MTDSGTTVELSVSIITLIVSLVVALAAVYFDHWLSKRAERKKILTSLYNEILENITILKKIIEISDANSKAIKNGKAVVNPFPALRTDMWLQAKSSEVLFELMTSGNVLSRELYSNYLTIYRINEIVAMYELLKLTPGLDEETHMKFHSDCLKAIDNYTKYLQPFLGDTERRFESFLNVKLGGIEPVKLFRIKDRS